MKRAGLIFFVYVTAFLVIAAAAFIFVKILAEGTRVMTWNFIFEFPQGMPPGTAGGIFPAIVGSLLSGLVAAAAASFTAIALAAWLTFFCMNRTVYRICRFCTECVSGIPSILLGLFGYSFFLMHLVVPKSVLTAGLTLAIMIVPFIAVRAEKIFREFSVAQIEAAEALGVSKAYILVTLIIRKQVRQLATTVALATAYAMGAAAPVMFTGAVLYARELPGLADPFMSLPYHLYILVSEGYSLNMAYGTAFVLLIMLLGINILCRFAGRSGR